jgi:lysophospholipase L1-like esterase
MSIKLATSSASRFRQSKSLVSFFLFAGSIFFALALAEGILRLFPGLLSMELQQVVEARPDNFGIAHPYIGYLQKPQNTFIIGGRDFRASNHTDGYGFRNAWPWPETAEIVTVGDSLTFGYGVEDDRAWPALIARNLSPNRLINLGLNGAGPHQYLRLYETFGMRLRPKTLLVGFFVRNDFWDADMFDRWLKLGAQGNYLVWRDFGRPRSTNLNLNQPIDDLVVSILWRCHLLASNSRLYNFLNYVGKSLKKYLQGYGVSDLKRFEAPDGTQLQLDLVDFTKQAGIGQPGHHGFDLSVEALQQLDSIARANGTSILVVLQPSKEEVYLPLMGETALDKDPGRPFRGKLRQLGISYIDLLPEFRSRAAKGEVLFFEVDGHPNARGYALIAELVLAHLKENAIQYGLENWVQTSSP